MTAKKIKKKTYKKEKPPPIEPDKDILDIFKENKRTITILFAIFVCLTAIVIIYTSLKTRSEDKAWVTFSNFVNDSQVPENISNSRVQETLNSIKGSTAEPWFLFYCSSYYMDQQDYDKALEMIQRLEQRFPSHLLVKEKSLVGTIKSAILEEKKWAKKIIALSEKPSNLQSNLSKNDTPLDENNESLDNGSN